jgi:chromosome segregation ATPase
MTTDQAKEEIVKWGRREIELARRKQTIESSVASEMLDPGPDTIAADNDRIGRAAVELRAISLAIGTAQERRAEALKEMRETRIRGVQDRIDALRKELAALSTRVDEHKKALGELLSTPVEIVCAIPGQRSRLQQMYVMIQGLTDQLTSLELTPIPSNGTVDLMDSTATADEVALSVLSSDSACPTAEAVLAWFAGFGETGGQRCVYLVWRDGQIDLKASYVQSLQGARR